jgi:glycosyltransferase involved in cell wall biosynthesis
MEHSGTPLVTIILTAYNHQNYIEECLASVLKQSYHNIELIVIDNASTDNTRAVTELFKETSADFQLIRNSSNKGLCTAFNQGLALAKGKYLIDLSGDDVLLPERVKNQVAAFELLPDDFGVVFTNALMIDRKGRKLNFHYPVDKEGRSAEHVPDGDVYKKVLEKYFICTPTMMIRTNIMKEIGGYDESLSFEDFDFWIRTSVRYKYFYLDEVSMLKRKVPDSLSAMVYKKGSGMLESYYAVCNKAYDLNRDQEEFDLLAARIRTFIRKCFYAQEFELAVRFRKLLNFIEDPGVKTEIIVFLCRMRLPVNSVYRFYINHLQKKIESGKDLAFGIVSW